MTDIGSAGGAEGKIRRMSLDIDSLGRQVGKARIPRLVTALTRPLASRLQPGVRLFDSGLNRSITVNAGQTGFVADGPVEVPNIGSLPTNAPTGLQVVLTGTGVSLYWNGTAWRLASQPGVIDNLTTRNWLSSNGLALAGMRVYVVSEGKTFRYDGTNWYTPGVAMIDLDYGVMKSAGRENRPMDAPMYTDGTISGDWNLVFEPGMYRVWAGATNTNSPPGAYLFGTLVVFGANSNINSRTQMYFPHQSGGGGQPFVRTAWNSSDWQAWGRSSYHQDIQGLGLPGAVRDWDGDWFSRVSRDGNTASLTLGLSVNGGSSLSADSSNNYIGLIPDGFRPLANFAVRARVYVGSQGASAWDQGWYANLFIYRNGQIRISQCNPGSLGSDCLISGSWGYPTP